MSNSFTRPLTSRVQNSSCRKNVKFVLQEERIATFDQDGTLWVEHPMYTQVLYCLDRVPTVVKEKPERAKVEPFKTVLSGNREAIAECSMDDLFKILAAKLTGMSVEEFQAEVKRWLGTVRDSRWQRPYTELTYLPMIESQKHLRANGCRTYIVTGGAGFLWVRPEEVYGVPPEQVIGTAGGRRCGYDKNGGPFLTKAQDAVERQQRRQPRGHPRDDRTPTGRCWKYTKAGDGARLAMLMLHDDAAREYAHGRLAARFRF
jgi:hypothetical protein